MTLFTEFYAPVPPTVEAQDRNTRAAQRDRLWWLIAACAVALALTALAVEGPVTDADIAGEVQQ